MSDLNNKTRGELIRKQILRDVRHHSNDLSKHIASLFSISIQAASNHIRKLEKEDCLSSTGTGRGKAYFLGDRRNHHQKFELNENFTEDRVWRDHFSFVFDDLPENINDICYYGFTEMVNNVIDHSESKTVSINVFRDKARIAIVIIDQGEGIFSRIKRLCNLADERQSILELSKGKLTTDPDNHSGEGIFFTSRMFDRFDIDSKGLNFCHEDKKKLDIFLDSTIMHAEDQGTMVYMSIDRNSERDIQKVFDKFTSGADDDFQFNKTIIPLKLATYDNEKLISRSQAKRVLVRIERFTNVVFDFEDVPAVGQAFADEIFRVYARKNPNINLIPVNMNQNVENMVNRAKNH
ncbi:STAS-like domain-containing protein [Vibrio lentus]|uniref:STAS-like domain-containing protein n=1 Tax=Vibrio lentus TaxID=136468 RepID=UPI0010BD4C9E|nr:DUF4325 domain-containing protein [Vibrio lentus]TKG22580.1 DUF4325 domain-containing protein [Vibrio lentus]